MGLINLLKNRFLSGHERSRAIKTNIVFMIMLKGLSIVAGLLIIPITIEYVDAQTYGLWLTISSIVAWMSFLDIGLNNGLRNKLTESIALNREHLCQKYISTTYALLSAIFLPLILVFYIVNPYINWVSLLNISKESGDKLEIVILIVFAHFCLKFVLSTINTIFLADQKPARASLTLFIEQLISILLIYILTKTTEGSLIKLCIVLCSSPLIVLTYFNFVSFAGKYKRFKPSFKMIDFSLVPELFSLGFKFFVIQIAAIVQYQTCNFIIMRYYGGVDVTAYNIVFKYFSILSLGMSILMTPVWSAVTDAFVKDDIAWINNMIKKYLIAFLGLCLVGITMLLISNKAYHIWLGKNYFDIPIILSLWVLIFILTQSFSSIYVMVLNGMGKLNIQFYSSFASPIIFLSISYFLVKNYHVGIYTIVIATVISNINGIIFAPLQYYHFYTNHLKKKIISVKGNL